MATTMTMDLQEEIGNPTTTADFTTPSLSTFGLIQRRHDQDKNDEKDDFASDPDLDKYYDVRNWTKMDPKQYMRSHKNIRRFYEQQNDLIDKLQKFYRAFPVASNSEEQRHLQEGEERGDGDDEKSQPDPAAVAWAINASFFFNIVLLVIKIIASALSGSMSVIASTADSLLDLLSGSVLVITHRLIRKKDVFRYPQGKSRMEPIGVFAFAIVMMLSSLQILIEAVRRLISPPEIELGPVTLGIFAFTILGKAFASWYCRKVANEFHSASAEAFADDHRNDVLTNCVGVAAVVTAVYVSSMWFLDSAGAICIALYIIVNWLQTGFEQMHLLSGRGAPPLLLQQLTYIASHHDKRIKFVDTVRAFHFGPSYLVEVDIVLPEDMPLRISHDIAESLQHRLEELDGKDVFVACIVSYCVLFVLCSCRCKFFYFMAENYSCVLLVVVVFVGLLIMLFQLLFHLLVMDDWTHTNRYRKSLCAL
jgi:cation diffusion facilitator family transporter